MNTKCLRLGLFGWLICQGLLAVSMPVALAQQGPPVRPGTPGAVPPQPGPLGQPEWFPLPAEQQQFVDKILNYWEHHSARIERYQCQFKRWEYANFSDVQTAFAAGQIMYAAPDKGLFEVQESQINVARPNEPAQWKMLPESALQKWVCDGRKIWEFDFQSKRLMERTLPPEMQGKQIVEGPLPFFFGASSQRIHHRYWVRYVPERTKDKLFWLEAIPKTRDDSANFRRLEIILDEGLFLPEGMVIHNVDGSRTVFSFTDRKSNWNDLLEKLNLFHKNFYEPAPPAGWTKVTEEFGAPPPTPAPSAAPTARRPAAPRGGLLR